MLIDRVSRKVYESPKTTPSVYRSMTRGGPLLLGRDNDQVVHFYSSEHRDGRGRFWDNIFIERLWRSVKYEEVYLKDYVNVPDAIRNLDAYFGFYNSQRHDQALGYKTPEYVFFNS